MIQSGPGDPNWRTRRRYPRVPTVTPVEIYTKSTSGPPAVGQIENLSVGGALSSCRESFDLHTELAMLFQLPTGFRIHAFGQVRYAMPQRRFGVAFVELDRDAERHLEEFTQNVLGYSRRSGRVPYRTRLIISSLDRGVLHDEVSADTVLVSRNGGLLVCSVAYNEGENIYLWSPERNLGIRARVVFQQVWPGATLVEVGFDFLVDEDFWNIDFPSDQVQ